jgi:hypothetical protein
MSPNEHGAIAVTNIVFCLLLALALLPPASMAGFNAVAAIMYLALLASIVLSFYLLAKRRELHRLVMKRLTAFICVTTLIGVSPLLYGIALALTS